MRRTNDGVDITNDDFVWEPIGRYVNQEVTWYEPEVRKAGTIPLGYPVFYHESNCRHECFKINYQHHPRIFLK